MDPLLEANMRIIEPQPGCIDAIFSKAQDVSVTAAKDERGTVFLLERFDLPAVFIELVKTAPGKIRGNHVHRNCNETLHVISGTIEFYLLCEHKKHVYKRVMNAGDVVVIPKNSPHALRSIEHSECIVLFENDPRDDRERTPILKFN